MSHRVRVGQKVYAQITVQDMLQLERDLEKSANSAQWEKNKTCSNIPYDQCMYNALVKRMQENTKDNCTVPFIRNNTNICTETEDIKESFLVAIRRITNQYGDCDVPCHSLVVNVGGKNTKTYSTRKYGEMYAYFHPR